MSRNDGERLALPERPSPEHLRKQAKRLARRLRVRLADAQHRLAERYGFNHWAALMTHVRALEPRRPLSPLALAARAGDLDQVRRLIAAGEDAAEGGETNPIWEACSSRAAPEVRLAMAHALLEAGADAREPVSGQRPLHAAAAGGPAALVELLIRHGAIEWEPNAKGRSALDIARRSQASDKAALVHLLDRPVIDDPAFRAAVGAIHQGDVSALERLLDAEPRLLVERILEPDCYRASGRHQYFLDPKLFWFVAGNPTLVERLPANILDVARVMLDRGIPKADLDYTLGLAMTSATARQQGLQIALVTLLAEAGATVDPAKVSGALAHGETDVVEHLVSHDLPLTAPIAAALGRLGPLATQLRSSSQTEKNEALDLAVINNRTEAAKLALEAGATVDRMSTHHQHAQPLHQAALHDNVELVALLIAHGAKTDVVDKLWGGTPIGWARHAGHQAVIHHLQALEAD